MFDRDQRLLRTIGDFDFGPDRDGCKIRSFRVASEVSQSHSTYRIWQVDTKTEVPPAAFSIEGLPDAGRGGTRGASGAMIRVEHLTREYPGGDRPVAALRDVTLEVPGGQFVSVMGPSGSGKSTLLNLIGALDRATAGEVFLDGRAYSSLSDNELSAVRRRRIGFVFQFFNLLPTLTARENVMLPAMLDGQAEGGLVRRADQLLDRLGLGARVEHRPSQLSGGEMQRVAVARALLTGPAVILADEPTGNLDRKHGRELLAALRQTAREAGTTVVMVTHDPEAAAIGDRTLLLCDGEVVEDRAHP